jgi:hypothetical protein
MLFIFQYLKYIFFLKKYAPFFVFNDRQTNGINVANLQLPVADLQLPVAALQFSFSINS